MRIVVTGSAGHLGEALVRTLRARGHDVVGLDLLPSPTTDAVASVADRAALGDVLAGADGVLHTAALHKPHVATHPRQAFVDVNVTGTLRVLEAAVAAGVGRAVVTSTTSAFGRALRPAAGAPAVWVTESLAPVPRNVYGATKTAAEDLARLVAADEGLACVVLRTSRFFPEADDDPQARQAYADDNLKVNELLHRRVDLEDVVTAHLLALERAPALGFTRLVVSATTPLRQEHLARLPTAAADVVAELVPEAVEVYRERGWRLPGSLDRVYVNDLARAQLGWSPRWTFAHAVHELAEGRPWCSELARSVAPKGYHRRA